MLRARISSFLRHSSFSSAQTRVLPSVPIFNQSIVDIKRLKRYPITFSHYYRSYTATGTNNVVEEATNKLRNNSKKLLKLTNIQSKEDSAKEIQYVLDQLNSAHKDIANTIDVDNLNQSQKDAFIKEHITTFLDATTVIKGLIMQTIHVAKKISKLYSAKHDHDCKHHHHDHNHDHHHHHHHHHQHTPAKIESERKELEEKLQFLVKMIQDTCDNISTTYERILSASVTAEQSDTSQPHVTPVSIITGFLGSGKTSLVNYILNSNEHGKRIAIIENEFGEVGIDDTLIKNNPKYQSEEEIIEMNNGCVCCTVRGDLIRILGKLLSSKKRFDHILIETTGLARTAPVAQTFFTVPELMNKLRIDGIITVVDSKYILQHLDEKKPHGVVNEAVEQIAFADRILLNKTDLVDAKSLELVQKRLNSINRYASVFPTKFSQIDLSKILDIRAFDLERATELEPDLMNADHHHHHDSTVTSVGIELNGEMDFEKVSSWLEKMLQEQGADIYRMKGVLAVKGMEEKFVFQGVHMTFHGEPLAPWQPQEKRSSKFVFIGKNLNREEIIQNFQRCLAD